MKEIRALVESRGDCRGGNLGDAGALGPGGMVQSHGRPGADAFRIRADAIQHGLGAPSLRRGPALPRRLPRFPIIDYNWNGSSKINH